MSMADLIGKIARDKQCGIINEGTFTSSTSEGNPHANHQATNQEDPSTAIYEREAFNTVVKPRRVRSYIPMETFNYRRPDDFRSLTPEP